MSKIGQWYTKMQSTPDYIDGWQAWIDGEKFDHNKPYAWQIGWNDARYEHMPRPGEP